MTNYTTLSDSELTEALNFHRRQRNMSRGINEAAHARQTQMVRMLEAEEARRLDEAVKVDKKNYSWGKMITVRHGSSHSFPLHPEHQEKIKNLKDGESTAFKDETGSHVTASREGDKVHLKLRGVNQKTTVAHSHFTESIDYSKEKPNKYVIYKHKDKYGVSQDVGTGYNWDHSYHHGYHDTVDAAKAWAAKHAGKYPHKIEVKEEVELDEQIKGWKHAASDISKMRAAQGKNVKLVSLKKDGTESKMNDATKMFRSEDEAQEHHDRVTKLNPKSKIRHNLYVDGKHVKTLGEEAEQIDEISKDTLHSYLKKASKNVDSLSNQRDKVQKDMSKTYSAIAKRSSTENAAHNAITQSQHNKATATYRSAAKAANKVLGGHSDLVKRHTDLTKKINKRMDGMDRAYDKMHTEEAEINEAADLRVTKIYNKWPKKATYAVHNANRSYFKEFDSEEAARAHHKEKTAMKEEVFTEAKLERNKNTVGAHRLDRDSGDHKMYSAYTGSLVRRLHTVTDKDDNILGQGTSAASAMAKAKLKKPHRDALMHDDNQIVKVHDTRSTQNVGTQVTTPGNGKWFKDHDEAIAYAKSLPGKIRHADPKTGHVD